MIPPGIIAVSGATGFTGEHVVRGLAARFPGAELRCLVRPSSNTTVLSASNLRCVTGDLRDAAAVERLLTGADAFVHVASLGFDWTDQVIQAVITSRVPRAVFFSTTAIFTELPVRTRPIRERAEALIRSSGTAWTIVRPTMIYGTDRDRNVSRLIRFVRRMPVVPLVAPEALQQPVHVEDVAAAVVSVLEQPQTIGRAYNLAGGRALTFRAMVQAVATALRVKRLLVTVPYAAAIAGVSLYSHLTRRPSISREQVQRIRENKNVDCAEAARDFGYAPRTFEQGVARELGFVLAN